MWSPRDRNLLVAIALVGLMAIGSSWVALRAGEQHLLQRETAVSAERWSTFIAENLNDLEATLARGRLSAADRNLLGVAISEGHVFRYRIVSRDGRVIAASRAADLAERPGRPSFADSLADGQTVVDIRYRPESYGRSVIGIAYVPFVRGGRYLGEADVHVDMTRRAEVFRRVADYILFGVIGLLFAVGALCGSLVLRSMHARDKELSELMVSRARAQAAEHEAQRANEVKSAFLATMSHEIRTPMNGVMGMISLLLNGELAKDQRTYATTAYDSAKALLSIVDEILDLSKLEAGRVELENVDFSFRQTVDQVISVLTPKAEEKGLELHTEMETPVPELLRGDPIRLRQVILNLIGNAIKFTEIGGVTVSISHHMIGSESLELRCEVVDTGLGIPPLVQDKLFSPFVQADPSTTRQFGGTGLGLSICREIVTRMGGAIGVQSAPGEGSRFWFTVTFGVGAPQAETSAAPDVPVATPVDAPPPVEETDQTKRGTRPLRLLVAEDNKINQQVVLAMLGRSGFQIDIVGNGHDAVEAVSAGSYDLVLMDIQMPEMGGLAATSAIRALPGAVSEIPIIALTANAMEGDREKYLAAGMNDYVSKPLNVNSLAAAINGQCEAAVDFAATPVAGAATEPGPVDAEELGELSDQLNDVVGRDD